MIDDQEVPEVTTVDAIAVQPKSADLERMDYHKEMAENTVDPMTYIVKIGFSSKPRLYGGQGLALFVGDHRIEKYSGYRKGIYFKIYDPGFFEAHEGEEIRLSSDDGETFVETGKTLPKPDSAAFLEADQQLPTQEETLEASLEPLER